MWVRSYFHLFWAVVNKSNAGKVGYYVPGPPLLNGRCTSLFRAPVSEMCRVGVKLYLYHTIHLLKSARVKVHV